MWQGLDHVCAVGGRVGGDRRAVRHPLLAAGESAYPNCPDNDTVSPFGPCDDADPSIREVCGRRSFDAVLLLLEGKTATLKVSLTRVYETCCDDRPRPTGAIC